MSDPALDLPLTGTHLLEASAGTGKTFALATLVLRLVVERGLRVGQILAVTYTEAATQELRERLRARLKKAIEVARVQAPLPLGFDDAACEALPRASLDGSSAASPGRGLGRGLGDAQSSEVAHEPAAMDDAESTVTHHILQRAQTHTPLPVLRMRLQRAVAEIDLAAVFTIHGFCRRVLVEHALDAAQAFEAPELVGSDRALREEIAADLWRHYGSDAQLAPVLLSLWDTPVEMAHALGAILRAPDIAPARPEPAVLDIDMAARRTQAMDALRDAQRTHGSDARAVLDAAIADKVINGSKARAASYAQAWDALAAGLASGRLAVDDAHLDKLTPSRLLDCTHERHRARAPASPLFDALGIWFDTEAAHLRWLQAQQAALLHRLRIDATARLARIKRDRRLQTFDDLIDHVHAALAGPHGALLAARLRAQYTAALVDEFQDTDARQWAIFRRVFDTGVRHDPSTSSEPARHARDAEPDHETYPSIANDAVVDADAPALFLIGDPKQAIYGFRGGDVHTYLAAATQAQSASTLARNFRSRPGVLRSIGALYANAGDDAFVDARIRFQPVDAGPVRRDADYQRDGTDAPALTVRVLSAPDHGGTWNAGESREVATRACVEAIHAVLAAARDGHALLHRSATHVPPSTPVQPGDIAVLVRTHDEALRIRVALGEVGIPAVAAGRQSVYATDEARELLAVFDALLHPADESRLRAALATTLVGFDAHAIAALDTDDALRVQVQTRALTWRERWQRHGPLALINDLCAARAPELLQRIGGERRLTNLLQLAELLQEADARSLGMQGLVDTLRMRMADADATDEAQLLRLESDARRVQVMTLHASKGLEFPLVFLPFAGIGKRRDTPPHAVVRDATSPDAIDADSDPRTLHFNLGDDAATRWPAVETTWHHDQRAEDARLLYVALTRAQHALWLAAGPLYQHEATALAPMLRDLETLRAVDGIVIDTHPLADAPLPSLHLRDAVTVPPARIATRTFNRDWWVYSFTQLAHAPAGDAHAAALVAHEPGATDEALSDAVEPALDPVDARFSGARFGNALHAALERVDFAAWRDWNDAAAVPDRQHDALVDALRAQGYGDADLEAGVDALHPLVGRTLVAPLPEGTRLCDVAIDARRAELEFHFALQPTSTDALLALLHAHGLLPSRSGFGARRRLDGLMTGKIDLTYLHEGRTYVLDYKSNRLPAYNADAMARAMEASEYTLQALLYVLALHRWLRFRIGDGYDYERDIGGVRYLFCRGLDADDRDAGVHAFKPSAALVHALDALFAGGAA